MLQTLIATMRRTEYSLLDKMNIETDSVVINQCDTISSSRINHSNKQILWINSDQRGLSRSRNMAIQNADQEICLLADDDIEYVPGYEKIILDEFKKNPNADLITFQVEGIETKFKDYYSKARKLNYLTSMKVSSVEVAFRLSSIRNAEIKFNELFGAGSQYRMGEENIFLFDCLRKKLNIYYVPRKIAKLHIGDSSWFDGYNERYFRDLGAVYSAMFKKWSIVFMLQFLLRKYHLYSKEISVFNAFRNMIRGRTEFLYNTYTRS